jgi:hypothetical protein
VTGEPGIGKTTLVEEFPVIQSVTRLCGIGRMAGDMAIQAAGRARARGLRRAQVLCRPDVPTCDVIMIAP